MDENCQNPQNAIKATISAQATPVPAAPGSQPQYGNRATDLPAGSPWWALWLAAKVHAIWASIYGLAGIAAEIYATYPDQVNEYVKSVVPASWWPHIVAGVFVVGALQRAMKQRKQP